MNPRFFIGQKVVCINAHFIANASEWLDVRPVVGVVYTVRDLRPQPDPLTGALGLALWLRELQNSLRVGGVEPSYSAWRFAPLSECEVAEIVRAAAPPSPAAPTPARSIPASPSRSS